MVSSSWYSNFAICTQLSPTSSSGIAFAPPRNAMVFALTAPARLKDQSFRSGNIIRPDH